MRPLLKDNENQAIRTFLMLYGGEHGISVGDMKKHMTMSGYPLWPTWVDNELELKAHLTKSGAQGWIRHLLNLETVYVTIED